MSRSTVCRHAKAGKAGLVSRAPVKRPYLTTEHKAKRVTFCKQNKSRDWKKVVFSDSKIWVYTFDIPAGQNVWTIRGDRPVRHVTKNK